MIPPRLGLALALAVCLACRAPVDSAAAEGIEAKAGEARVIVAQGGGTWDGVFSGLSTDKLAVMLIFGAASVGALGFAAVQVIRAVRGSRVSDEELTAILGRLESIDARLARIEKGTAAGSPSLGETISQPAGRS
jgi:hypothetical protein